MDPHDSRRTPVSSVGCPPDRARPERTRRPASLPSRPRTCLSGHAASLLLPNPVFPGRLDIRNAREPQPCPPFYKRGEDMPLTTQPTSIAADEKLRHPIRLDGTPTMKGPEHKSRMVRLTVNLPSDLVEQLRDAVYWTPGVTLAWMIARSVRTSLAELESTNQGPFPKRAKPLRAGRPRLVGQSMNIQPQPSTHNGGGLTDKSLRAREVMKPSVE